MAALRIIDLEKTSSLRLNTKDSATTSKGLTSKRGVMTLIRAMLRAKKRDSWAQTTSKPARENHRKVRLSMVRRSFFLSPLTCNKVWTTAAPTKEIKTAAIGEEKLLRATPLTTYTLFSPV
jgi:hypothetical protein